MTNRTFSRCFSAFILTAALLVLLLFTTMAKATECPKDAKSCKVLVLTPEEEQTLVLLISQTAVTGPYNQVKGAVDFWTKKITEAPAGDLPKPEPEKPEKK